MAKFQAPSGSQGIAIGGQFFPVGSDGCISVPDDGEYQVLIRPHGFTPGFTPCPDKPGDSDLQLQGEQTCN